MEATAYDEAENAALLPMYSGSDFAPEMVSPVVNVIRAALGEDETVVAASVVAGRVYTRKGAQSFDGFTDPRNPSYGSPDDDYYLEVGVRISHSAAKTSHVGLLIDETEQLYKSRRLDEAKAHLASLESRKDAWDRELAKAENAVKDLEES